MSTTPSLPDLDRRIELALGALVESTGGASLCAVARSGQATSSAKYHEGSVSALTAVRRRARQTASPGSPVDLAGLADAERVSWQARYGTLADRSTEWAAYLAGGLDALGELG